MSYMDQNVAFAPAGGIQDLCFDEIDQVGGGNRGDATANGAVNGATTASAGMIAARYSSVGARIGVIGGFAGIMGGAILGGAIGYAAYEIGEYRKGGGSKGSKWPFSTVSAT